jgi:hypothetical protein
LYRLEGGKHFPNHLLDPVGPAALPRRNALLAVLVLLCLAMRAWMASQWHIVWSDAVDYIHIGQYLERGDLQPLLSQFGANIYPLLLVLLHAAGLSWEWAGPLWGLTVASLTVLPLFGWVRRQFDDRVALLACLLYAIHPKLMILSPQGIRDSTFWFLLVLTLYLGWRAVREVKPWLFAVTGLAWALAVHTRTEGLLLVFPVGLWWAIRWPAVPGQRRRLLLGGLLGLAMLPAWIVLMNLTLLRSQPHWVWLRSDHVETLQTALSLSAPPGVTVALSSSGEAPPHAILLGKPGTTPGAIVAPHPSSSNPALDKPVVMPRLPRLINPIPLPARVAASKTAVRLMKSFTYLYGLLVLAGLGLGWRVFLHCDQQAMFLFHVPLWLLIWLRQVQGLGIDIRYTLPCVIIALPYAALALQAILDLLCWWTAARVSWTPARRAALAGALLAAILCAGTTERSREPFQFMVQHADLGKWILARFGPQRRLAGHLMEMRLVAYYAHGEAVPNYDYYEYAGEALLQTIRDCRPDVLLLWSEPLEPVHPPTWRRLLDAHAELGLCRVPAAQLPPSCQKAEGLVIAVRRDLLSPAPP